MNNSIKFFVFFFLFLFSCKEEEIKEKKDEVIQVYLTQKYQNSPFRSSINFMTKNEDTTIKFYGVKKYEDETILYYNSLDQQYYEKIKKIYKNDTLENMSDLRNKVFVLTGYKNENQYYIVDKNGNLDFDDDNEVKFSRTLGDKTHENRNLIDSFPTIDVSFVKIVDSILINNYHINMQVFPEMYYYTVDKDKNLVLNKFDKPSLKFRHTDYFLGSFSLDSTEFKLALSKGDFKTSILIEKSQKDFFPINDYRRQEYTFLDTLQINNKTFQISKIKINPLRIELKKVIIPANVKGFRIGQYIDNYVIEDLKGDTVSLKKVAGSKELTLIDFWGTWCAPCKELTPSLVRMHKEYGENVQFLSLAYEKDAQPVLDYIAKNEMVWFNGILKGTPKSNNKEELEMISKLRIDAFPTFILLDKDLKIIYRGVGNKLEELEDVIKSYHFEK